MAQDGLRTLTWSKQHYEVIAKALNEALTHGLDRETVRFLAGWFEIKFFVEAKGFDLVRFRKAIFGSKGEP